MIIIKDKIDTNDKIYKAWKAEKINLYESLNHAIAQNWIDVSRLDLDDKYSDSAEIYTKLIDYIINIVDKNTADFKTKEMKLLLIL